MNLVRTRPVVTETAPYKSLAFGHQRPIPSATILICQPDEVTVETEPRASTRLDEQHEREQAQDLRLPRHQIAQEPSKTERFRAEIFPDQLLARLAGIPR